jgi:ArsR family transcriptional regulator
MTSASQLDRPRAADKGDSAACRPARRSKPEPIDVDDLAALMKALGHSARIEILRHLADHGTCYFGDLSEVTGLAPSTTSQHVTVLKEAGLVIGSAEEQRTCYCINADRLAVLKRLVGNL